MTTTTFSGRCSVSGILVAAGCLYKSTIFSHIWAVSVEITPSFWTLPSLKSALQNHEGPTETRKGHSAHGRKAPNKIKPTSETEGRNHYSQSANNQSINRSIDRSINQSTNHRRIDQSVNQSIDESTNLNSSQDDKTQSISPNVRLENNWQTVQQSSKWQNIRSSIGKRKVH